MTQLTYEFELPVIGSDNDEWGSKLNDNWTTLDGLLDGTSGVSGIDINGGSIDGTPIGAASASTGAFTTISASGDITGNLKGDIKATDGTVVLNNGTDGTDATFTGTASSLLNCTATGAELSTLASSNMTAAKMANLADLTVAEVDILDGATITTDELNYLANATSEVQAQIDGKQATLSAGVNVEIATNTVNATGCPSVVVGDVDTSTSATSVNTSWVFIPVNTEIHDSIGATENNTYVNLPAGTYYFEADCHIRNSSYSDGIGHVRCQLVNESDTQIGFEHNSRVGESGEVTLQPSGKFTIAATTGFRLKVKASSSGRAKYNDTGTSAQKLASRIKFWKVL